MSAGAGGGSRGELPEAEVETGLPPQDVLDRLKAGASLVKLGRKGKPKKRHFALSSDLRYLEWVPSNKRGQKGSVCLDDVDVVQAGQHTAVFERFKQSKTAAEIEKATSSIREDSAASSGEVTLQGWLHKKAGGGGMLKRRNWSKRWFIMGSDGCAYYTGPTDLKSRRDVELSRDAVIAEMPHEKYSHFFTISQAGQPPRSFYAESEEEMNKWIDALSTYARMHGTTGGSGAGSGAASGGGDDMGGANPMASMRGANPMQRPRSATLPAVRAAGKERDTTELSFSLVLGSGPAATPTSPSGAGGVLASVASASATTLDLVCATEAEFLVWFPALQSLVAYHKADIQSSIEVYEEALKVNPEDAFAHVSLGQSLERQGKLDEALTHYRAAQAADAGLRSAIVYSARVLGKQATAGVKDSGLGGGGGLGAGDGGGGGGDEDGDGDDDAGAGGGDGEGDDGTAGVDAAKLRECIEEYKRALAMHMADKDTLNAYAQALERQGKAGLADAVSAYEEALALDDRFKEAHFNIAGALEKLGRRDEAMGHYQSALAIDPRFKFAHVSLGLSLERQNNPAAAAKHYRSAISIDANFVWARTSLALLLEKQNKFAEAILHHQVAARVEPDNHDAHALLALAYKRDGAAAAARTQLRRAIEINSSNALTRVQMGRLLEAIVDARARAADADAGADADGDGDDAAAAEREEAAGEGVDTAELEGSRKITAEAAAASAADDAADDAAILALAEEQYRAGVAADARNREALNCLGLVLRRKGDNAAALEQFKAVLRVAPLWAVAKKNLDDTRRAMGEDVAGGAKGGGAAKAGGGRRGGGGGGADNDGGAAGNAAPVDDSLRASLMGLSSEEREAQFFKAMASSTKEEEEAAKRRAKDEFERLDDEEKERIKKEKEAADKHVRRQSIMLTSQLTKYGAASAKGRGGPGRGRGAMKKRRATVASGRGRGRGVGRDLGAPKSPVGGLETMKE